jgi:hypothetical protein
MDDNVTMTERNLLAELDELMVLQNDVKEQIKRVKKLIEVKRKRDLKPTRTELEVLFNVKWQDRPPAPASKPAAPRSPSVYAHLINDTSTPYGTHGCWDYPNAEWSTLPTVEDVPELCRQKLLRTPKSALWHSEEDTLTWLINKGYIDAPLPMKEQA